MDFYQFPYSKIQIQTKSHLKRSLSVEFERNRYSSFLLRGPLKKPKTGLPNLHFSFSVLNGTTFEKTSKKAFLNGV